MEYPISFIDAVLGTKIEVPTIEGFETIKIDPGTESGTIIPLKKKGAPIPNSSSKGDMYIQIMVRIPAKIDKTSKKFLEEIKKSIDDKYIFQTNKELKKFLSLKE